MRHKGNARQGGRFGVPRRRGLALLALAGAALAAGLATGAAHEPPGRGLVQRFGADWQRGDYAAMYALLAPAAQRRVTRAAFAAAYRAALATATASAVRVGQASAPRHRTVTLPVRVRTRIWGTIAGSVRVPVTATADGERVRWDRALTFPGLRRGERLSRSTRLGPRGTILARDGTPLAQGADRSSPIPVAAQIAGSLGPIPAAEAAAYRARGYPPDAKVGVNGLERVFQDRLAGRPGGELLAGGRVLARAAPEPGDDVRSTIDPAVERAAVAALGGHLGGVIALRPSDGQILAAAGIAWSVTQPPGSTFKIVTVTGVLEAGLAKPSTTFPYETAATLSGVQLHNADGESCGGTLVLAFAVSCNSVFAPLGAQLGAAKLVAAARAYGFGTQPPIPGAVASTIPDAGDVGDDLAVGATAIGQGRVAATVLEMTEIAATVANRGRRPRPTLALAARPRLRRVTSRHTAHAVARLMRAVVTEGTGTAAQIPGVEVAGKTGTAELQRTVPAPGDATEGPGGPQPHPSDTDAWFVCFAPLPDPRVAVGVMLVRDGAGGSTAAPAARQVLETALAATS